MRARLRCGIARCGRRDSARLMRIEIALQAERLLVELGGKRRRGIDGALDGIEARAGFGGGLLGGGQGLLQLAQLVLNSTIEMRSSCE